MYFRLTLLSLTFLSLIACSTLTSLPPDDKPLSGVIITVDPGHGNTKAYDRFRVGPTGEREEWINLRVAKYLSKKLKKAGAEVYLTRTSDVDVSLGGRATLAKRNRSDMLISIHHNGSGNDPDMDLPIVYFYGPASINPASVDLAQVLIAEMREKMSFEQASAGAVYSDHLIYSSGTSILRNTINNMPGIIGEGGFFTSASGEQRLKSKDYNKLEADVYFQAVLKYVEGGLPYAEPLIADSIDVIDLNQILQFQLDDGFGGAFFQESSLHILQDGEPLESSWNSMNGIITVQPLNTEEDQVSFQVFGRNFKGNAIHPIPYKYQNKQVEMMNTESFWGDAFHKADSLFAELQPENIDQEILEEALHCYRLSLDLQIVHPKARKAEEQILALLLMQEGLSLLEDSTEVEKQHSRIKEYYPELIK